MNSKQKGKRGELEAAKVLREYGFEARRGQQYKGGADSPDVVGMDGIHIEVKRTEALRLYDALAQSKRDSAENETPIVLHRKNGERWVVIMELDAFIKMYGR